LGPNVVVKCVLLVRHMSEVLSSNCGLATSSPDWRFQWLSSVPTGKCWDSRSLLPAPYPFQFISW